MMAEPNVEVNAQQPDVTVEIIASQGPKGDPGADGNGVASVEWTVDHRLKILLDDGSVSVSESMRGADGHSPVKGVDYWTEAEQRQILEDAAAQSAPVIVNAASGETIALNDAVNMPLRGLKLFGKTVQDGTPTPDAPVDPVSAGDDGSIQVTIEGGEADAVQTLALSTPNGLPGIPVASDGNYTDSDGQQWVCDEIDLARGVYVQRIGQRKFDGSHYVVFSSSVFIFNVTDTLKIDSSNQNTLVGMRCSHYPATYWSNVARNGNACALKWGNGIAVYDTRFTTTSEFKAFLQENPITVCYIMSSPVETPLDEDTIAAFAALRTCKPDTTLVNDSGAGMQVDYAADTKLYIDNKFALLAAALVANT